MTNYLYSKHNYTNKNIAYLRNNIVREYDMVNAGINILKHNNVFTQEEVDKLNSMSKLEKSIKVGKFLKKNPNINEALMDEFIKIRKELFEKNGIEDDDILSIKKDAIFVINKKLNHLQLNDDYIFKEKNKYSSYMYIDGKEFYYDSKRKELDVKGYSKVVKEHHKDYLFKDLAELIYFDTNGDKDSAFKKLIELKHDFVQRELPIEYYLDITQGTYVFELAGNMFGLDNIDESLKQQCNISNNLNFIIRMINILLV